VIGAVPVPSRQTVPSWLQVDNILGHLTGVAALDEVCRFLGHELPQFVSLAVYRVQEGALVRATSPLDPPGAPESIPAGRGAPGRAVREMRAVIIPELGAEPDPLRFTPEGASQLAVPISAGGRVVGVFAAESRSARAFDPSDARFLERVAQRVAATVEGLGSAPPGPAA
jgi:putative methionine-R-sulfoxide reductase with GAF domain